MSEATTICITSALPGEGKSVTAVALARIMAMSGDRVLLIDCDLRRSGLAKLRRQATGAQPEPGLMQVLDGQSDPEAALVQDVVPGLSIMGTDAPMFTGADVFAGPGARDLLAQMRRRFDFIILDAPPVLAVADACSISKLCDVTVLVVRYAKTARAAVRAAADRLGQSRDRLGVVINRRAQATGQEDGDYDSVYTAYYRN